MGFIEKKDPVFSKGGETPNDKTNNSWTILVVCGELQWLWMVVFEVVLGLR